jgi:transposase, IS5 family
MPLSSIPALAPQQSHVRLAFGSLFIKQRLGLSVEETVEHIRENAYMRVPRGIDSS